MEKSNSLKLKPMNLIKMTLLSLITWMLISCVGQKSTNEHNLGADSQSDTLKFTSGIRAIFQDSKGNYWFGSLQEGLAMFNGKSFTYFTSNDGLSDNQIHSIQEDSEGNIWLSTLDGVSSYDGQKFVNHTKIDKEKAHTNFPIQLHEPTQEPWTKSEHDLWFGAGTKEGVYKTVGQGIRYFAFPAHEVLNPHDNLFAVTSIAKGKNNLIWFGTYAGVFGFDGKDFEIINDKTLGFDRKVAPLHIRSTFEDSKGRLWIGNNGIGVLLKDGDSIISFSEKHHLIHPSSHKNGDQSVPGTLEHVFTIAEDRAGNIWFGDRDAGIWKYDGEKLTNYTKKEGLSNDFALSILEDKQGTLWFGMQDGSIYTFNGKSFEKRF